MQDTITEDAISLATQWLRRANQLIRPGELKRLRQLERLMAAPSDKVTLTRLIDQSFRSRDRRRVADQMAHILTARGIPEFFSRFEKNLLNLFLVIGRYLPSISVPQFIDQLRKSTRHLIIPGEPAALRDFLHQCRREGAGVNINHIGEAVLGEKEARRQLET
jgi:RHH-type proline utilization regulon transcriptional repressor/proline dehydrogenase/delta 1-pyrroline-5-carboxylate dehydrogenase